MSTPERSHLAEANVARLRAPLDDPTMAGLVRALDDVNWLAERSPGFVWRHRSDSGPVTYGQLAAAGEVILTISVWTHYEALHEYVYRTAHGLFMQRRVRWFQPIGGLTTALWWVPEGHQPTVEDALRRIEQLRAHGSTPSAFSLRHQFGPDGARVERGQAARR